MTTEGARPDPNRWKALAVLGVAYLMVVLDVSIVNVALPSIQSALDFSPEDLQWVVSGYALTFGSFLLLGGRLGDLLGRRRAVHGRPGWALSPSRCSARSRSPTTMLIVARAAPGRAPRRMLAPSVFSITLVTFAGGRRAQQGARHPRRDRRRGRGDRRAARRRADRVRRLGVDLLRSTCPSACVTLGLVPRFVRESRVEGMARNFDSLGADHGDRQPAAAGLRPHPGQPARAGPRPRRSACSGASAVLMAVFLVIESRYALRRSCRSSFFRRRTPTGANIVGFGLGHDRLLHVLPAVALHAAGARLLGAREPASATWPSPSRRSSPPASRRRW